MTPGPVVPAVAGRSATVLETGWQFRFQDEWTVGQAAAAPDAQWQSVDLPHTWNRLGEYREERTAATDNRQGTGWYRRTIDGRVLDPSRRHYLEFDAVGNVADVWLNGQPLGRHAGAFTRFRLELGDALDYTGPNLLIVRADNSDPKPGIATADVIPLLGDFFVHGGIYRPARLVSVPASHIALDDFGGPGVYATPTLEKDGTAAVSVEVRLTGAQRGQELIVAIAGDDGREITRSALPLADGLQAARTTLVVPRPRLWNGRRDPHLYSVTATLLRHGAPIDTVRQPFGIRTTRFDPDEGFFLNGERLELRGVSRHQDRLGQGWALSPADEAQDMAIIAEMGANSVRVAHYPQSENWFDLADRAGMVVWAEVPFVNKPSFGDAPASDALRENARVQMTEMIRQNFNHPSIVTWGIGNEVDIDLAFKRLGPKADARPLLRELNALSHAEDPSRPTVLADCCESTPGEKAAYLPVLAGEADLMGYNRYFGWYYGKVDDLGPHLDMLHARHPAIPLSVSEYGAGGALTQHSDHPEGRPTNVTGRPQPEEFQAWWHEQSWPQIRERKYLWGSWIWNMFDFSSRIRREGDATDINTKGLVSYDRTVKKDAFYYYKAQWSSEPVVHITSRRFDRRAERGTRIKIYSNAPGVAVTLNDRPLGEAPCIDRVCVMTGIELSPGINTIGARATFGDVVVADRVEWRLVDAAGE
ncbi:beta-galactosidase [Tsuneonella sp. YG55]|uniref:Beta-galactosidase n=1 Tax=Tsuneonella litorea TaxID=2976475 RepID=A0A9X2W2F9_9SPHN|nr:glycoside hydrolase family 2 TIM barrel-domain containing protein [Tsuneonella litorea]MCT2559596.1 beta-galactosidase [Tsuneonella litorea]